MFSILIFVNLFPYVILEDKLITCSPGSFRQVDSTCAECSAYCSIKSINDEFQKACSKICNNYTNYTDTTYSKRNETIIDISTIPTTNTKSNNNFGIIFGVVISVVISVVIFVIIVVIIYKKKKIQFIPIPTNSLKTNNDEDATDLPLPTSDNIIVSNNISEKKIKFNRKSMNTPNRNNGEIETDDLLLSTTSNNIIVSNNISDPINTNIALEAGTSSQSTDYNSQVHEITDNNSSDHFSINLTPVQENIEKNEETNGENTSIDIIESDKENSDMYSEQLTEIMIR